MLERVQLEPKLAGLLVMFSFVWLSKAGFSIKQLMNTCTESDPYHQVFVPPERFLPVMRHSF